MMKSILTIFLCLCVLSGCNNPQTPKRFRPVKNPKPNYFLTLTGTVSAPLPIKLILFKHYETQNSRCNITINQFEGAEDARIIEPEYPVTISKKTFTYKLPLDDYLPGYCQWKLSDIRLYNDSKYASPILFDINKKPIIYKETLEVGCDQGGCKITKIFNGSTLTGKKSHAFKLKIVARKPYDHYS